MRKPAKKNRKNSTGLDFPVGQCRKVRFGDSTMKVEIVEDRGNVGLAGHHLVRVRYVNPYSDPTSTFEVYAENLLPLTSRQ